MSKYVDKFGIFTAEGWGRINEFLDTKRATEFVKDLDPLERYALTDAVMSSISFAVALQNAEEGAREALENDMKSDEEVDITGEKREGIGE